MSWRIAVDTGGTFTDLVARHADGRAVSLKVPSTPHDPGEAVRQALARLETQVGPTTAPIRHGTTVATNALLEGTLAPAILIVTAGFEDLLALRRQNRPDLYALHPVVPPPAVPRHRILGLPGRRGPTGDVIEPLPNVSTWVEQHRAVLKAAPAIAICLLHAYVNGADEAELATALRAVLPDTPITLSHVLCPVFREYERAATCAVNAALAPVMRRYLDRLDKQLTARSVMVMHSAGGLIPAESAALEPVRTALSGPAGGVRGAWAVGRRTGVQGLLAFDMGGTSTDVSVVSGPLIPMDDGAVAGHPLRVPLLPIDTVGAGGGSIAWIDAGGALQVGPQSAGAQPGPACYGRGGRAPTVTDAHVALGRLDTLLGGTMALDVHAARTAIASVASAQRIIDLAEATMARACKRVALSQGLDPRQLTLVAFGGAGGLHACGLADALDAPAVLFPVNPGVLSAEGILHAPVETSAAHALSLPEAQWTTESLQAAWNAVVRPLGSGDQQVLFDCRYAGQTHMLPLQFDGEPPAPAQLRAAFLTRHATRYGHTMARPIECVALRAFARQHPPQLPDPKPAAPARRVGPVALSAYGATLWLPAHWAAERLSTGDWRCTRLRDALPRAQLAVEVFREQIAAIAEEMGETLMRAAFSANIKERRDFSCAVFDAQGQLIAHAAHIPVHLGSTPLSVQAAMSACTLQDGVSIILNDPFAGGTHLPDVTLVTPVFIDGRLRFIVANRAHHADVGGISPGSLPAPRRADGMVQSLTIDDEGVRLPPQPLNAATRARFVDASRVPGEREGDLRAQEAANHRGAQRLKALIQAAGDAAIHAATTALLDYAERRMRAVLSALPDGEWTAVDALDDDGVNNAPVSIPLRLVIRGDQALFDWTAAPDAVAGPLNAVRAITLSAAFYCMRCLAGADLPANAGLMRPLTVRTRPGSIVDAQAPAAVSSGNVETSQRLVDIIFAALAQAAPNRIPAASCGSMNNVLFGGVHAGRAFVHYETLAGGAGGGPAGPGADGIHVHMTNTLNTPIEAVEQAFPVRIMRYALAPAGPSNGGRGVVRAYRFLGNAEVTLMGERRRQGPPGEGAAPRGTKGRHRLIRADGTIEILPGKCAIQVQAGDTIEVMTPGGGGWH